MFDSPVNIAYLYRYMNFFLRVPSPVAVQYAELLPMSLVKVIVVNALWIGNQSSII